MRPWRSPIPFWGWFLHAAGRNEDTIRQFKKALELDAKNYYPYGGLGYTYARLGMMKEAEAALLTEVELMGRNSWTLPDLAYLYGKSGRSQLALGVIEEMRSMGKREPVQAYSFLLAYTGLSERDPAYREAVFEWLHKSYAERTNYAGWINGSPWWDHVRSDPRFAAVMKRMGFEQRRQLF
jgi:Flp pilus assembly protein TadD